VSADKIAPALPPVEETLAYEAQQRPRAIGAAVVGGVAGFAGAVLSSVIFGGGPDEGDGFISLPEAMESRLNGQTPNEPSLFVRQVDYYGDNVLGLSAAALLTALGAAATALVLIYLYRAVAARMPISRTPLIASVVALVALPIGHLVQRLTSWFGASGFSDQTDRSAEAARDVFQNSFIAAGQIFELLGQFALSTALVLIALNAMRAGLLTRFLGVLGIIVGVLAFPLLAALDQPQLIRMWWLLGIALLLAGKLRGGLAPAWVTGRAEPWPSQQELREARERARGGEPSAPAATSASASSEPSDAADAFGGESAGQRRKRKKRR